MAENSGLLGKITRAFWLQVGLITLAAVLGVYLAKIVIDENLVRNAILEEANYFWEHYRGDEQFQLPDTKNLTGYFDPGYLPQVIQRDLPTSPGYYAFNDLSNKLVLHLSQREGRTLYLIYFRGQVDNLVLYYGLFPLLIVLTILYLTLWFVYRFSHRSISPLAGLARKIDQVDFDEDDLNLSIEQQAFSSNDEVRIVAEAISHLGERLQAFMARERNFTRDASHELRSPLTVINVAADMMLIEDQLSQQSQQSLLKIKRAVYDMQNLTDVFLMLAREQDQALTQREVDVNQVIKAQLERNVFLTDNKDVDIALHERGHLRLFTSETVVAVLLGNLMRNALLYTRRGEIKIDVDSNQVTISDSGPGIPESHIDQIFEPFQRGGADNAAGYGIGLTIVKRLCDRFGWRIEVASNADSGTRFTLNFE